MPEYIKPSEAREIYGYSRSALVAWEEQGILKQVSRTPGGQRRYLKAELESLAKGYAAPSSSVVPITDTFERPRPKDPQTYEELGTTGLRRFGGSVAEERLRELRGPNGRERYKEMKENDPVLSAVFFAVGHSLKATSHRISPASDKAPDKEAAEFIESAFDDMSQTFLDVMTHIVDPTLEQGFSLVELIYKKRLGPSPPKYVDNPASSKFDDGRIGWRKWSPRPAESLVPGSEWIFDDHGGIQGINQQDSYGNGGVFSIPIHKLLHFRTTVHPANTPEPPPIHRPAYLPYWYTNNFQEIEGIGVERDLGGMAVMYLGNNALSLYDTAREVVTNIRVDEQGGIVVPYAKMGQGAAEGEGVLLELLASPSTRAHDVGKIIERYDKRKALIVLAQFIMLGMEQVGSYALSRHQGDLFMLAAGAWLKSFADIINRHAIPRLMALNAFPGTTGMPTLEFNPMGVPNLEQIANFVNRLVEREVITPDIELEKALRSMSGLPEMTEEVELKWERKNAMSEAMAESNPLLDGAASRPNQSNGFQAPNANKEPTNAPNS